VIYNIIVGKVITDNQLKILEEYVKNGKKFKSIEERKRFNRTLVRLQDRVDEGLVKLVWLAINCPELLLDEERELADETLEPHRRLKKLFKILANVNPRFEVALVIKKPI